MNSLRGASLRSLRAGDVVKVRPKEEIFASLNKEGMLEGMPFMPEMPKFCGHQFRVAAVAHKTYDPAHKTGGRKLDNTVHLAGLRCDGSMHEGCQASCLLFWKIAWLDRADSGGSPEPPLQSRGVTEGQLLAATQAASSTPEKPIYSCQATRLFNATRPLRWWDVRQCLLDVYHGNVTLKQWTYLLFLSWLRALLRIGIAYRPLETTYSFFHRILLGRPAPDTGGGTIPAGTPTPVQELRLRPGQWARVKSHHEIRKNLTKDNKNRGMWFDDEATTFCGDQFQVEQRIDRIINEITGEMMPMKTPCITLKGEYCRSLYSRNRLFCPRAITPYWHEIWLQPIASPDGQVNDSRQR